MSTHSTVALRLRTAQRPAGRRTRSARFLTRLPAALAVAFVGLGAVMHFLPGRPVMTVDSFFHLSNAFNCGQDTRSWTYLTSTGQPNANLSLLPADCSIALLQSTGLPLWVTEAFFEALLAMAATAGMYLAALRIGGLLAVRSRNAAIVAALLWVANPFALAYVWYHVLYFQVLWAALPWLGLFVLAAERDRRIGKLCLGAFAVGVAAAPGLTQAELPQTFLVLAFLCLFLGMVRGRGALLRSAAVVGSCGSALLWWLLPSLTNLGNFYATATKNQNTAAILDFASHYSTAWHLLTLAAVPQLYQTVNGVPYIAWSGLVTSGAGKLVLACIPVLGAAGIVRLGLRPPRWKQISPLVGMLALGVLICKGEAQPLPITGVLLTRLPLGAFFRQPLNNFGLLIVVPLTLFVGFGLAAVFQILAQESSARGFKRTVSVTVSAVLVGALAVVLAPWWSSHVFPAGGGVFPSAKYVLPAEYREVGTMLAQSPAGGKTLELPFTNNEASAFVWPAGIQPNADPLFEAWQGQRSVLEHEGQSTNSAGFEVAHCISAGRPSCLRMAEHFGIDRLVVHLDWNAAYFGAKSGTSAVSSDSALAYLLGRQSRSIHQIARSRRSRVAVGRSGSVSLYVDVRSEPRRADRFLSFDGFYVQLNRENFFGIYSPSRSIWSPGSVLPRSPAYYLTLTWSAGKLQLWINGQPEGQPVPFRHPPRDLHILPPGSAPGTWRATSGVVRLAVPRASCGIIPCKLRGGAQVLKWGKYLALISLPHASPLLSSRSCGAAAPAAALPSLLDGGTFVIGRGGCEHLEFGETYDKSWTLAAVSPGGRVSGHRTANHFYNQWTVRGPATAVYALRYSRESSFLAAALTGALVGIAYLGCVFGAEAVLRRRHLGRHAGGAAADRAPSLRT